MQEKVIQLISDATKVDMAKITMDTSFVDDLNLDSLDIVELMMKMEVCNFLLLVYPCMAATLGTRVAAFLLRRKRVEMSNFARASKPTDPKQSIDHTSV